MSNTLFNIFASDTKRNISTAIINNENIGTGLPIGPVKLNEPPSVKGPEKPNESSNKEDGVKKTFLSNQGAALLSTPVQKSSPVLSTVTPYWLSDTIYYDAEDKCGWKEELEFSTPLQEEINNYYDDPLTFEHDYEISSKFLEEGSSPSNFGVALDFLLDGFFSDPLSTSIYAYQDDPDLPSPY